MVTVRANIVIVNNRMSYKAFPLACLYFTLTLFKGQDQGHAQFDCEFLTNVDR